jgi:hypothetical protein
MTQYVLKRFKSKSNFSNTLTLFLNIKYSFQKVKRDTRGITPQYLDIKFSPRLLCIGGNVYT